MNGKQLLVRKNGRIPHDELQSEVDWQIESDSIEPNYIRISKHYECDGLIEPGLLLARSAEFRKTGSEWISR